MIREQLLEKLGMTSEQLEDKITNLALAFANVTQESNLNPLFAMDAILRFASSMVFSLAAATAGGGDHEAATRALGEKFVNGFNLYLESITRNSDINEMLATASPEVQAAAAKLGIGISNPKGYEA